MIALFKCQTETPLKWIKKIIITKKKKKKNGERVKRYRRMLDI